MLRHCFGLLVVMIFSAHLLSGQHTSVYRVHDGSEFNRVAFSLESANGHSIIRSHNQKELIAVYGDTRADTEPAITEQIVDGTKQVTLAVDDRVIDCVDEMLFASEEGTDQPYRWQVLLSRSKPVDLDLHYAMGDAFLDLSDLDVKNLRIRSGHANVVVDHLRPVEDTLVMDSLFIDVDWGSVKVQNIHRTRTRNIRADVGFGKMNMDLTDASQFECTVNVSVGAGKLAVQLPEEQMHVKVVIADSPLCRVRLAPGFIKTGDNEFTLPDGRLEDAQPLVFNVNVGMGSVEFLRAK